MNRDDIIRMAREAGYTTYDSQDERLERFAKLVLASREPLSDERVLKVIEEQCALTGWKVPPTVQVARAIEREHGIGGEG